MSREERRAYERQMKSYERGPALPASARSRAQRHTGRGADKRGQPAAPARAAFDTRFWIRSGLIAAVAGVIGFSMQWGEGMPWAMYVGLAIGALVLTVLVALRYLQRRATAA